MVNSVVFRVALRYDNNEKILYEIRTGTTGTVLEPYRAKRART